MEALTTSADVFAAIRRLYGDVHLGSSCGVVHVVSTWTMGDGSLAVIAIGPQAPGSATDFFVLNLARARADAIITTGSILRNEPALRYDLQGPSAPGLASWRREALGKAEPPTVVVLTAGAQLDFDHPSFHSWARPVVFTSAEAGARLRPPGHVEVVGHDEPTVHRAIAWARSRGAETISVEAGPTTARALYEGEVAVDELLLSRYRGELHPAARGRPLVRDDVLAQCLAPTTDAAEVDEPSGRWSFERWVRPSSAP